MAIKTIEIDVKVDSKQAVKGVDDLSKSTDKLGNSVENTSESTESLSESNKALGGSFGGVVKGAQAAGKAFLALALNPIGIVIAAIAVAVLAVKTAFTSSEKGQDKYNKLMGVLGSILGNLTDLLADFGFAIIEAFENPLESLKKFADFLKQNIINRFEGMVELIPQLGKAVVALFEGDFSRAGQIAADASAKVAFGVENITEKIKGAVEAQKEFIEELEREAVIAGKIAEKRSKADRLERSLIVERAKADRTISELRERAARRDLFNSAERKAALEEALVINENIVNKEIAAAKLRSAAIQQENTLSKSTKEAKDAEAQAIAQVIILETKKLNLQKRLGTELAAINLELAARQQKEADDAEKKAEADLAKKTETDLKAKEKQAEEDEIEKQRKDKIAEEDKEREEQRLADLKTVEGAKAKIREASLDNVSSGVALIASLDEESKALQAASIVASNAVGVAKTVINTQAANSGAVLKYAALPGGQALAAREIISNNISAGIGIATSIAATVKGLSSLKKSGGAGSKPSLPSGGGSAAAPSINTETLFSTQNLDGAETEEISSNKGINQIKAIVVESDITNAQKNINDIESKSEIG